MQRITITLDDDLLAQVDQLVTARGYQGRSEAIRDLARSGIQQILLATSSSPDCVAALVYVYDHAARDLAQRLMRLFHQHHDLTIATTHVHLNHGSCMEVSILKGPTRQVQGLADFVFAERGVRHGRIVIVPAVTDDAEHQHDRPGAPTHSHIRAR